MSALGEPDTDESRLRSAVERYEQQVRLFEGVTSTTPDFVYLFDPGGRFVYANRRLLEVWGMTLPQIVGRTCRELGYEQWHHDMHMREIAQVIETRRPIKGEVPFEAPLTGIFGVYEYIFTPVLGARGEVELIAGTTRDVTERKRAEQALLAREERHRFLLQFSDALRPIADPQQMLAEAMRRVRSHLNATRAGYADVCADGDAVVILLNHSEGVGALEGPHRISAYDPRLRDELAAGRTVVNPDVAADPGLTDAAKATFARLEIGAMAHVPLVKNGRLTALLFVHSREARTWDDGELQLLESVAARTWDAVERTRAEAALRESDRRKDEFIAMLAHELRNPLAPIRTSVAILRTCGTDDPVVARCRDVIDRQTAQMARLLEDLLDVSRLSRGSLTLVRAPLVLQQVVDAAVETSRPLIDQQRHRLTVDADEAPIVLDGDAARLAQVFANLLNNAAKYSAPEGRIAVAVHSDGESARVAVKDTGIGMTPELLSRAFDLFSQGGEARALAPGGLGIGLSLARRLVEMHGGTIRAASAGAGHGSEFTVTLPLAASPALATDDANAPLESLPSRRVLVADDNVDAADTLSLLLSSLGCKVRTVYGGSAALREAADFRPDIVLLDLGMPDVDGCEVCRRLRAQPATAGVEIVAISGWGQQGDRRRTARAGFDRHLVKPVDAHALADVIRDADLRRPARRH